MASVNIKVNLITKAAELQLQKLSGQLKNTGRQVEKFGRKSTRSMNTLSRSFRNASIAFGNFGILLRAGLVGGTLFGISKAVSKVVTEFATFEKALVGVGKTTNLTGKELEEFGNEILTLSDSLPASSKELLNLAQIAAQLGVRGSKNLRKFAEVGVRLAASTDLAADAAVTSLARIIGVTSGSQDDIENLGSVLVELGNTFKAQESEILTASGRVARATAGFNLAAEETLAIGAALKEAGIEAESGGSAVGRVLREIAESAAEGGDQFKKFQQITGQTADELIDSIENRGAEAFEKFIDGLAKSNLTSVQLTKTLKDLQLNNIRVVSTVAPLVNINDRLTQSFKSAREEVKKNQALNKESEKVFSTVSAEIEILVGRFNNLFTAIGKLNSGVIKATIVNLSNFTESVREAFAPDQQRRANLLAQSIEGLKFEIEAAVEQRPRLQGLGNTLARIANNKRILEAKNSLAAFRQELKKLASQGITPEVQTPRSQISGPDIGGDLRARAEARRVAAEEAAAEDAADKARQTELNEIFFEGEKQAELDHGQAIATLKKLQDDEAFQRLVDKIGAEEALKTRARARELVEQGKSDRARALVTNKIKEAQLKKDIEFNKKRERDEKNLFQNLTTISRLGGQKLFETTKKVQTGVAIIDGFTAIQKALAAPPGFPFNIAGVIAATAQSVANVSAIKSQSFQDGGVVAGTSFSGDKVTARVNSGEMILNRAQQAELFKIAQGNNSSGNQNPIQVNNTTTLEVDGQTLARAVSKEVANGVTLGEFE